ncbi:DUF4865 family protein [Eleftheria terrae]|uniref:DUF4865 family protein n=1 Tax=Eleftheria terrae TaxID=1597781 RepID=UPI00263AF2BE|nr:DUF4865 family protein [Eleftheria terrae]WKB54440.1 DUF4865 family protein [Eleftheria terrae]
MLAMQYSITLPASFEMDTIRERIAAKGHLMDGFGDLAFKAFLYACRGVDGPQNLYAPFYLWHRPEGATRFLAGEGFAVLAHDFGRPSVSTWLVLGESRRADLKGARWATRQMQCIEPHSRLPELQAGEAQAMHQAVADTGALAAVSAFSPQEWRLVQLRLWAEEPPAGPATGLQRYRVGHVATG